MQTEKILKNRQTHLKNKDTEMWRISELIDCCKYFQQQKSLVADKEETKTFEMITLLTSYSEDILNRIDNVTTSADGINEQQKARISCLLNSARKENIIIKNIGDFYNKWKLI